MPHGVPSFLFSRLWVSRLRPPELQGGLHARAFRVFQRQLQLPGQRIHRRALTLPGALAFEAQIADSTTPRSDNPADRPEVAAVGVFLIESPDDIRRNADKGA